MTTDSRPAIELAALAASQFHELKNQLGQLALALDEVATSHPDSAAALREPRINCRAIVERLVQILTLYKRDEGRLLLNVEAHDPAEFLNELAAETRTLCGPRLTIMARHDTAPPFWFFDRYLVQIALSNALHNALKFARARIEISAEARDGGLLLSVRDDSAGYPAHILADQGRQPGPSASGTGLGLFFAHSIAQAHDNQGRRGELRLTNADGACFQLWLP